jgi:hypothetical protein
MSLGKWRLIEKLRAKDKVHDFNIMAFQVVNEYFESVMRYRGFGTKLDLDLDL